MINKEKLFRDLYANYVKRNEWLDKYPSDYQLLLMDNEYTSNIGQMNDMMLRLIFGEHTESIEWFMYEWQPGYAVGIHSETIKVEPVKINNIDEYIEWMKIHEGFGVEE